MRKVFIVNVGVNTSHGSLRSPRFSDGTFEFVTIPDDDMDDCSDAIRYCELPTVTATDPKLFVPEKDWNRPTHFDPDFSTPSYGDLPKTSAKAANLLRAEQGDFLVFYARLVDWKDGRFLPRQAGMYFIGYLTISEIYGNIDSRPAPSVLRKIRENAHILRAECEGYDRPFHVFVGSKESRRLKHALPFTKSVIRKCGITDASGDSIPWDKYPTESAVIGRYFRSIRMLDDARERESLMAYVSSGD